MSSVLSFPAILGSAKGRQRIPKGIRKMKKRRKRIKLERREKVKAGSVVGREPPRPTLAPGHTQGCSAR